MNEERAYVLRTYPNNSDLCAKKGFFFAGSWSVPMIEIWDGDSKCIHFCDFPKTGMSRGRLLDFSSAFRSENERYLSTRSLLFNNCDWRLAIST